MQALLIPTITYSEGGTVEKCGDIRYEIKSAVRTSDSSILLGSGLNVNAVTKQLELQSSNYGLYDVIVKVSFVNYPAISADSQIFSVEVVDCGEITLTAQDQSALKTLTY